MIFPWHPSLWPCYGSGMCQSQPMGTLLGSPRSNHSCPERNFQNAIITQTRMCNKSSDTVIPGVQIKYSLKCLILSESRSRRWCHRLALVFTVHHRWSINQLRSDHRIVMSQCHSLAISSWSRRYVLCWISKRGSLVKMQSNVVNLPPPFARK